MSDTTGNPLDDPAADPFEVAAAAAADIARITGVDRHYIALTLGSGWGKDRITDAGGGSTLDFSDVTTTLAGSMSATGRAEFKTQTSSVSAGTGRLCSSARRTANRQARSEIESALMTARRRSSQDGPAISNPSTAMSPVAGSDARCSTLYRTDGRCESSRTPSMAAVAGVTASVIGRG